MVDRQESLADPFDDELFCLIKCQNVDNTYSKSTVISVVMSGGLPGLIKLISDRPIPFSVFGISVICLKYIPIAVSTIEKWTKSAN